MPKSNFVRRPMNKILEQRLKDLPNLPAPGEEAEKEETPVKDTFDRFIDSGQEKA